eukprot:5182303-Pyramimonas_sp.AAC.2
MENSEGNALDIAGVPGFSGPGTLAAYATASLLFPASYQVGCFFAEYRLPCISGYLVTGVICGPYFLAVLTEEASERLWLADDMCLVTMPVC